MPWEETNAMNEKVKFISAWLSKEFTLADLCRRFNISRVTGYKIIARYENEGISGLDERPRAHFGHPHETNAEVKDYILKAKTRYSNWGPRKIKQWLELKFPDYSWPAASTIGEILKKHGLVKDRKKRKKTPPHSQPFIDCTASNEVWSADFKGHFKLGNLQYCYPLTISDNYSRFLIECKCLPSPTLKAVKESFERIFKQYGLPKAIKTDNGIPFASVGIGGLSQLSIWWLKLGITPERILPGHPEQNGRHERMHRTLKEETTKPSKPTMRAQQVAMSQFKEEYNYERPHEALVNRRPADVYERSTRAYPSKLPQVEYDASFMTKKVKANGEIKMGGKEIYVGSNLGSELIGLKAIENEQYLVYFTTLNIGILDLRLGKVIRPVR